MIDVRATLKQAADAYKAGDKAAAQRLCLDILTVDPTHADTLFLSSFLTDVPNRQVTLLQMALERDPNHARARARLDKLQAAGAVPHGSPSAPSAGPMSPTPAFSAPIESVPPKVASPAPFPASPARPLITPLPRDSSVARPAGVEHSGKPAAAVARRRSTGSTLFTALLVIVLVIVGAGVALTLLNRQNQAAGMPTAVPNIVLVTRTPLPTQAPSETPSATATLAATTQAVAGVATVPVAARTGPGSPSQPVPLGTPFTLTQDGAPVLTLRVDEVIRGDEAARRIAQASPLNPALPQGYEYALLRIVARLDPDADRAPVRPRDFVGFSQGALYPIDAEFLYPPPPDLDTSFGSPGAETSGWVIVWLPAGDAAPLAQFSNAQWPDGVYFATR